MILKKALFILCLPCILYAAPPAATGSATEINSNASDYGWWGFRDIDTPSRRVTASFYAKAEDGIVFALHYGSGYYEILLGGWVNKHSIVTKKYTTHSIRSSLDITYSSGARSTNYTSITNPDTQGNFISIPSPSSAYYYYQIIADGNTIHVRYYNPSTKQYILLLSAVDTASPFLADQDLKYLTYSWRRNDSVWHAKNFSFTSNLPSLEWDPTPGETGNYHYVSGHAGDYFFKPGATYSYTDDVTTSDGSLQFDNTSGTSGYTETTSFVYNIKGGPPTSGRMGAWCAGGTSTDGSSTLDYTYYYDPNTQRWQHSNLDNAASTSDKDRLTWTYDTANTSWYNERSEVTWQYNTETKRWTSTLPYGFGSTGRTHEWSYNHANQQWTNHTRSEVWDYLQRHIWKKTTTSERWYNSATQRNNMWLDISAGNQTYSIQANSDSSEYFFPLTKGMLIKTDDYGYTSSTFTADGVTHRYTHNNSLVGQWTYHYPLAVGKSPSLGLSVVGDYWHGTIDYSDGVHGVTGTFNFHLPFYLPPTPVVQHQHIINTYDTLIDQNIYTLGFEWENNGRTNTFSLDTAYDTSGETAPLKTSATSPDTQLLHDLTHNPVYTSVGKWQHKDTTNSHEWDFDPATGIWRNVNTGYQWQFSDLDPGGWSDSLDGATWAYDENTNTWTQTLVESD